MDNFGKFYNRALKFLSFRPRSEKEIRDYLELKTKNLKLKTKDETIDSIIKKLKEHRFLNDEEFARLWIESRLKYKPRSISLIKRELLLKGVDKDVIDAQISNLQFTISNELENAQKLIIRKIERYKDLSKQEIYQKLGRFLAGKGFNWDTIKKSIDESLGKKV
ncbi:MAG: hypothetical protein CO135_01745 [Candidatus Levybacteria bacterium CG_4_9_14_3_um_filter_35_16]|nr:MAG: hypothetical protein COW87_02905 [Candidatus Levybacteria bacterium CG22_combo_CG10-13_8_21_14_all_35_11]PJA91368.1 MAG: hypothetical protein CO135_01745 [Candidatus Levybacteria bacterium CG_4_9_14_3_um_filter_35_16]PJC54068.1 MAG: hypothetical protein CO028_04375 [Candidatus Levybacteria bacterium CG_4_9_14_0_2_um_filter_35_21]